MSRFEDVLRFWFDELRPPDWWRGSSDVDRQVADRFGAWHETLEREPPDPSSLDARGHLGAVLVLDQFSRHLHRDTARAFASDPLALSIAEHAIGRGLDAALTQVERQFLYMPWMHAESASRQARSLALFGALGDADALRSARQHADLIERFGRFPTRNAALGRVSTGDEQRYLAERRRAPTD